MEDDTPKHDPMKPKQAVTLRSRAERDDGGSLTAGQKRAAAELDRIKRDQVGTVQNTGQFLLFIGAIA